MERQSSSDIELIHEICSVAGNPALIEEARSGLIDFGIPQHPDSSSNQAILDWLLEIVAFQGISDSVASTYMTEHGRIRSAEIARGLGKANCPKLGSYWSFHDCGYQKSSCSCSERDLLATCPLPQHDFRNGRLNQTAYALVLFVRDIADNDLVGWIDHQLEQASATSGHSQMERWAALRNSLLVPMTNIYGLGEKVLSMALSDLLLGGGEGRPLWREAGAGLIAVDSLVHNWLHRTGLVDRWGRRHPYGAKCYAGDGCAEAIERLAMQIDARAFNPAFPKAFPRFLQKAIWSFCAASHHDRCNGNHIRDAVGCRDEDCPLGWWCERRSTDPNQ